jgi:hypothetical protein
MNRITTLALSVSFLLFLAPGDRTLFGTAAHAQALQAQSPQRRALQASSKFPFHAPIRLPQQI